MSKSSCEHVQRTPDRTEPLHPFETYDDRDVRALIAEYPLAWVHAQHGARIEAALLPLIGIYDSEEGLVELVGHLSRANPLAEALAAAPCVTILFQGPSAYVSPEQAGRRDWGPTWNYAQLMIRAEVRLEPERTGEAVALLVDAMESGRARPWSSGELGTRYPAMLSRIVGFRARVLELTGRFKLGQDEQPDILRTILSNLPDPALERWMRRFNPAVER